jgi:hypothetical protein
VIGTTIKSNLKGLPKNRMIKIQLRPFLILPSVEIVVSKALGRDKGTTLGVTAGDPLGM